MAYETSGSNNNFKIITVNILWLLINLFHFIFDVNYDANEH